MSSEERHGINIPTELLERIKQKEEKGDYKEDNLRFTKFDNSNKNDKKRKVKQISRKEKRQQERELKKQKRVKPQQPKRNIQPKQQNVQPKKEVQENKKNKNKNKNKTNKEELRIVKEGALDESEGMDSGEDEDENDIMNKLRKIKEAKKSKSKVEEIRIVKEDDLDDDSFSEEEEEEEEEGEEEEEREENEEEGDEDPMEQLRRLKAAKGKGSAKSTELRVIKEDDLDDDSFSEDEDEDEGEGDPMEQLRKLKAAKGKGSTKSTELRVIKEDDLDDDSFSEDEEEERDFDEEDDEGIDFDEDDEEMDFVEDNVDDEDPMEQLRKLKAGKAKSKSEVRVVKEDDLDDDSLDEDDFSESEPKAKSKEEKKIEKKEKKKEKKEKKKEKVDRIISARDLDLMRKDEEDMAFYAKKLGLKNGKNAKLSKQGDDDIIGGLLDGLDFGFSDDGEGQEDYDEIEEEVDEDEDDDEGHNGEDDNEDDEEEDGVVSFDEGDFDEDELRELREMEELENSDEEVSDGETHMVTAKENPYIAPATSSGGYIPPALRRKMALEASESVSEETLNLQRSIKRLLNKLSEANISSIINEINQLYTVNPRQLVTENLTSIIMDSIQQQGRLLDNFVNLHACVIVAVHKLQGGMEFGAFFIQTLVERFDKHLKELTGNNKEISNLISLLSSVYTFQLISSKLLYDIIKLLISDLTEANAELLLRLIQNSGNQMRSDDPQSLKEIILMINEHKKTTQNTRTQFLIETITSLKNNKLKVFNEGNQQLIIRMKKVLGGIGKHSDPLQVSLEDIRNVDTRGKWWLIGSAWKGYDDVSQSQAQSSNHDFDNDMVNDILDNAEPNWVELARSQRMNTDIRRAIFISIMSANDYVDAMTKLDKLALKRAQEREIPRIIIHCTGIEPAWNPYYGVLAAKLCESHSYRKTFQFMLWDILKDLDKSSGRGGSDDESDDDEEDFFGFDNDNDVDDETKLKRILNLGRFFGYLLAEGSLPLNILRNINFLATVGDTLLFLEILFITFLDQIAKKSQLNAAGAGTKKRKGKENMSEIKFDERSLIERVGKAHEQPILLKGIRYFLNEKAKKSAFITGRKQRVRVDWGIDTMSDLIDDLLKGGDY